MSQDKPRFAIVVSTAGSVMDRALGDPFLRGVVDAVAASEPCDGIAKAERNGLPVQRIFEQDNEVFCERLMAWLDVLGIDYVLSFYTRFYSRRMRDAWRDRIVNFHPSILPAFKGMDGFGDQVRYDVRLIGTTVEFIDQVMDEGKIVMQTVFPHDPSQSEAVLRHRLFVQQCRSMVQVVRWLHEGRIQVNGRIVRVRGASYDDAEFSPALDFEGAIGLKVPDYEPV